MGAGPQRLAAAAPDDLPKGAAAACDYKWTAGTASVHASCDLPADSSRQIAGLIISLPLLC